MVIENHKWSRSAHESPVYRRLSRIIGFEFSSITREVASGRLITPLCTKFTILHKITQSISSV